MLYNALLPFADDGGLLNLIRYITLRTGGAAVTALALSLILGPALIRWLKLRRAKASRSARTGRRRTC